ncbi:hypothetical protein HYX17_04050 [Candidatus Woesearchaeota archaeon]|nr:hypothetical protein [Candidatus Woesearchaeota archaeon]
MYGYKKKIDLPYEDAINPIEVPNLNHSSGTLVFNLDKNIDSFIIKIDDIPLIQNRVFEWK